MTNPHTALHSPSLVNTMRAMATTTTTKPSVASTLTSSRVDRRCGRARASPRHGAMRRSDSATDDDTAASSSASSVEGARGGETQARASTRRRTEPVGVRETIDLGACTNAEEAWRRLSERARETRRNAERYPASSFDSGCVRFVVDVPRDARALEWIAEASGRVRNGAPAFYWSPRAKSASGTNANARKGSSGQKNGDKDGSRARTTSDGMDFDATRGARAGLGACATWTDAGAEDEASFQHRIASMRSFLSDSSSTRGGSRVYGAGRFDPGRAPESEWASFGTHYFFLPTLEVVEGVKCATLTVSVAWDARGEENCGPSATSFVQALDDACETLARAMGVEKLSTGRKSLPPGAAHVVDRALVPDQEGWSKDVSSVIKHIRASRLAVQGDRRAEDWIDLGNSFDESDSPDVRSALESLGRSAGVEAPSAVLDQFEAMTMAMDQEAIGDDASIDSLVDSMLLGGEMMAEPLRKVVLARRSKLKLNAPVDSFMLVSRLQSRDPDAYQFVLRHPNGETFLGSTPERLFLSHGGRAVSEAVAGTRARGADEGEDAALAYDMLLSPKEHEEFAIVREEVRRALAEVADGGSDGVEVELEKGILRNVAVQHLYARLSAPLASGKSEADLVGALHPTPAVCGYPRQSALQTLRAVESFDRGLYSGPLGWISSEGAEFSVAIRSALVHPSEDEISLYAGVGVVGSANAQSEWHELNLKTKPLESLLAPTPTLASLPNPNAAWATILIGELVRGGVTTFCIAPGSRSTPLALAAEKHVGANVVVCIDERSLGFYALGYAKGASKPAAVICSSGTAVANLLPAAVEASESSTPLLLLTADRPYELRDTGANQTIDQVKIFGSYARYCADMAPPGDGAPARACATTAATALRYLRGTNPGPVHLNCSFREPLGPQRVDWDSAKALKGLENWESSSTQFTIGGSSSGTLHDASTWQSALERISSAKRGVLVVGGGTSAADSMAATAIAKTLGWAVAADATSGMRVGAGLDANVRTIPMIDYVLVEPSAHEAIRPDVILQVGSRLTSKRLCQFLEASAIEHGAEWIVVDPTPNRLDPAHCVSVRVESSIGHASNILDQSLGESSAYAFSDDKASCVAFAERAVCVGAAVAREASMALNDITTNEGVSEMAVAVAVSEGLPDSMGLFLGNSMPIRDVDAFAGLKHFMNGNEHTLVHSSATTSHGVPVTANRGASGIDGVISSAAGYAAGLGHPVTLIIGDVSFQHDANGLLFLRERPGQPPVTVVVVNNGGGGIFSFLPVAGQVDDAAFNRLFATPPDVSRRGLCEAHRVSYSHPVSMAELNEALRKAWNEDRHNVIEVTTSRARNLVQHRIVQRRCSNIAQRALDLTRAATHKKISDVEVASFSIPLAKPVTTMDNASATRDGWILKVKLANGAIGYGEAAPLPGLHRESLAQCGAQISTVATLLSGLSVPTNVALLNGAFGAWLTDTVGVNPDELLPTVRFALESAVATAVASGAKLPLTKVMSGEDAVKGVLVNGLIDSQDIDAACSEARELIGLGYRCLKVKVARGVGSDGAREDAERLAAIRSAVGPDVVLRADANRRWDFTEALDFGAAIQNLGVDLQYVEEPTRAAHEASAFHFTTGVPVALDETIDDILRDSSSLAEANEAVARVADQSTGVAAMVLKPSVVGGLEATISLARVAMSRGVRPIISSAFESGVGLKVNAHLAAALDNTLEQEIQTAKDNALKNDDTERPNAPEVQPLILALDDPSCRIGAAAHGLGTASWFKDSACVISPQLAPLVTLPNGAYGMQVDEGASADSLSYTECVTPLNGGLNKSWGAPSNMVIETSRGCYDVKYVASQPKNGSDETIVLLHGFMGSSADWNSVAHGLCASTDARVVAVDLPAHGSTTCSPNQGTPLAECLSMEAMCELVTDALSTLGCAPETTHVVAYSMGARIALTLGTSDDDALKPKSIVSIGGSPGLRGEEARAARAQRDDEMAEALRKGDVAAFSSAWYRQGLFASLAAHPRFGGVDGLAARRASTVGSVDALADCLSAASPGRQPDTVWDAMDKLRGNTLLIVGERDAKFKTLSTKMRQAMGDDQGDCVDIVPNCGHAVHLEAPEALVKRLVAFIQR